MMPPIVQFLRACKTPCNNPDRSVGRLRQRRDGLPVGINTPEDGTGARYTRAHPPVRLLASRVYPDRSSASIAEAALKKLPRQRKPEFFSP